MLRKVYGSEGSQPGVVERVAGLVQERLVVVQPALRARDQVDDLRRVGRDHAGARRLLRPVVEVELDVRLLLEIEAELRERVHADSGPPAPWCRSPRAARAGAGRRRATSVGTVLALRRRAAARASGLAQLARRASVAASLASARARSSSRSEMPFSSSVRSTGSSISLDVRLQLLARAQHLEPLVVERRRDLVGEPAELVAVAVAGQHRELRLGRPQRQLLALELDPRGEDRRSRARPPARRARPRSALPRTSCAAGRGARAPHPARRRPRPRRSAASWSRVNSSA